MTVEAVLGYLRVREDPEARAGMARVGIDTSRALGGTSVPALRSMARRIGKDHALALELWGTGIHEARLLATMVDDPRAVTEAQMEAWVAASTRGTSQTSAAATSSIAPRTHTGRPSTGALGGRSSSRERGSR